MSTTVVSPIIVKDTNGGNPQIVNQSANVGVATSVTVV